MLESDDNCSACLGKGNVLCCEGCPRVFHFSCVEEGFEDSNPPEGAWLCKVCRGLQSKKSSPKRTKGLFGPLLDRLETINPRAFLLPKSIRESYEYICTYPPTGAFMNMRDVVVTRAQPKTKSRITRSKNLAKSLLTQNVSPEASKPAEHEADISKHCHKCGKTSLALSQTSFLASNSVPDTFPNLQTQTSNLIKCDYCPLYWHLDCLSPPLASVPHQLLPGETEWIDLGEVKMVQSQLWTGRSPLDPQVEYNPQVPLAQDVLSCHDMYALESAAIGSPMLATYRYLNIRHKWMCPCHADWVTPKLKPRSNVAAVELPERPVTWMGTHDDIVKKAMPRLRIVYSNSPSPTNCPGTSSKKSTPSGSKSPRQLPYHDFKNNGHIEIKNTQETLDFFDQIKYVVPEKRIEYEFFDKVRDKLDQVELFVEPQMAEKLAEFDATFYSKLEAIASSQQLENRQELESQVNEALDSQEGVEKGALEVYSLMQPVAALLLMQLEAQAIVEQSRS